MTDIQQLQQKHEGSAATSPGRRDPHFERGFEEYMRGHLDDCMSHSYDTSCSSPRHTEDEDDDADQLVRRRRRSDLEGDDLAESSAARRRHSRILGRWAARQAHEMITTMERRNRESELMALAGLHPVSMLDYSFLRESQSPSPRMQGPGPTDERPAARASSTLQMWRELEEDHLLNRARERLRNQTSVDTNTDVSTMTMSESREEGENREHDFGDWSHHHHHHHHQVSNRDVHGDGGRSSREPSPDLGEVERERVRQIVRGWMESGINERSTNPTRVSNSPREEWLGETERERVRLVREWVHMASQQRVRGGQREDQISAPDSQVDPAHNGLIADNPGTQREHISRDMWRLRGRQALIDLLVRIERERQRELQGLMEHRAVSDFAHRNRIQSLLRGRFLRNDGTGEDERTPSLAASELLHLRQQHTVSGLREGFRSRLETQEVSSNFDTSSSEVGIDQAQRGTSLEVQIQNSVHLQPTPEANMLNELPGNNITIFREVSADLTEAENAMERADWQEQVSGDEPMNLPHSVFSDVDPWRGSVRENVGDPWQGTSQSQWPQMANRSDGEAERNLPGEHGWDEVGSRETLINWSERPSDPPRIPGGSLFRRVNRFHLPDEDNVYSMELRELLSRRSVSTLLRSGFRESLDQLIQSYVQRQDRVPVDWDLHSNLPNSAASTSNQGSQRRNPNVNDRVTRPSIVLPSPPVPPPQPLWPPHLHHSWSRQAMHRSELEWEMMNDLRADVMRLQQGMNHMQRMLEACMDMQLELQRSVRQEVSAALNRSAGGQGAETSEDGSQWGHVKKGTCCVCCDSHIDSLLYRCGHMCTCLKCANELVRGGGKCPLCRAPIAEVIRAYSIL